MLQRAINTLRLITILVLLAMLTFVYASLPENVGIWIEEGTLKANMSRSSFFYFALSIVAVTNVVIYSFGRLINRARPWGIEFSAKALLWVTVLAIILNIFYTMSLWVINMFNRLDSYSGNYFGILVFIGIAAIVLWLGRIIFLLVKRQ